MYREGSIVTQTLSKQESVHAIKLEPGLSRFYDSAFCIALSTPMLCGCGAPSQKYPHLLWRGPGVAPGWP
jgi:hypothetical protein